MKEIWDKKWQDLLDGAAKETGDAAAGQSAVQKELDLSPVPGKDNHLMPDGKQPKNDLLPGIGGDSNVSYGQGSSGATDALLGEALSGLLAGLAQAGQPSEAEQAGAAAMGAQMQAATNLRADATAKDEELYRALTALAARQEGRYDTLIEQVSQKGYQDFPGTGDLLSYYAAQGDRAAGHALAGGAAENGGHADSYAAAQAARTRLGFTEAGQEAALAYYRDQLGTWLSAIEGVGRDTADLYALMGERVDATHGAASDAGKLAQGFFSSLTDLADTRAEAGSDLYSSLLSHYAAIAKEQGEAVNTDNRLWSGVTMSPMELDREFAAMTEAAEGKEPAYSKQDALILLWKKYPTMHEHLLKKYDEVLNPQYSFRE